MIALDPEDWSWATWRRTGPLAPEEPVDLDLKQALAAVAKAPLRAGTWDSFVSKTCSYWRKQRLPRAMTPEHAHFWFEALSYRRKDLKPKLRAEELRAFRCTGRVSFAEAERELNDSDYVVPEQILALTHLLTHDELLRLPKSWRRDVIDGLRAYVLPRLSDAELAAFRAELAPRVAVQRFPKDVYACSNGGGVDAAFYIAASTGMHDEMKALAESWSEDHFADYRWNADPQRFIFGLGNPSLVLHHFRRQKLKLTDPADARAWLACTELAGLEDLTVAIVTAKNKEIANGLAQVLVLVDDRKAAPYMKRVVEGSKAAAVAQAWLDGRSK